MGNEDKSSTYAMRYSPDEFKQMLLSERLLRGLLQADNYQPEAVIKTICALESVGSMGKGSLGPWLDYASALEDRDKVFFGLGTLLIQATYQGPRETFFAPDRTPAIRRYFNELEKATNLQFTNPHDAGLRVHPIKKSAAGNHAIDWVISDAVATVHLPAISESYARNNVMPIMVSQVVDLTPNESASLESRLRTAGIWAPDATTRVAASYFQIKASA